METVTTTVLEVHRSENGVIDLTTDQATQVVNGDQGAPMNGVLMAQQQAVQDPALFDMDLERMHTELFKGRYLTPQDFLDDVGKMVHNANVRAQYDLDRLHKAQAMFTAAQVSIQEFDPQLRSECERMAVRERQRRNARKKEKEKSREENGNGVPAGMRRSARNNGLQPEHPITDPVKLERRLKRQRGDEGSGGDSHGSEGEANAGLGLDGGRDAKRTRIIDEHDDDRDPLDTLGGTPGSGVRSHVVRFAPIVLEPMAPLIEVSEVQYQHQSNQFPAPSHPSLYQGQPNFANGHSDQMVVDPSPRRALGFDPALLNPMQPADNHFQQGSPFPSRPNNEPYNFPSMSFDPSDPFVSHQQPQQPYHPLQFTQTTLHLQGNHLLAKTPTPPLQAPPRLSSRSPALQGPDTARPSRQTTPLPLTLPSASAASREPTPMIIERTPTPPLPDFHVSPELVSSLRQLLTSDTTGLTIEQLEQLRATCLGTVWRHRKDWDRNELVTELLKEVKEFVEEVMEENGED